jgi:hypothetical protein
MNGKKVSTTHLGETRKYTRRLYPGDIYIWESPQETHTKESQQQSQDDCTNQN